MAINKDHLTAEQIQVTQFCGTEPPFSGKLLNEKRIGILPLIFKEIIIIDDHEKGFLRGTIEGASDTISDEQKNKLLASIPSSLNISAS